MAGFISVHIDDFTPCLKDNSTGELVDTEVVRIRRSSFLSKYNKQNGWYVNWGSLAKNSEIYALVVKGEQMKNIMEVYTYDWTDEEI